MFHPYSHHPGFWAHVGWWLPMVVFVVLVGVGAYLLVRLLERPRGPLAAPRYGPPAGAAGMPGGDSAIAHARYRYANGDLSREDYLRIVSDLSSPSPWSPPPPSAPAPPPPSA
jgi:uncharacterized membrane protein